MAKAPRSADPRVLGSGAVHRASGSLEGALHLAVSEECRPMAPDTDILGSEAHGMTMPQVTPTPYGELNSVLAELVVGAQAVLGDNFRAAYLQGSFAVGDFD